MKSDLQLKDDVEAELAWDPAVNATGVGVAVKDGVVTLTGHLDTFVEKHAAERAVRRVEGVRGMAVELDVKLAPGHQRTDSEVALAASVALGYHVLVPAGKVRVEVEKGWVTLTGDVPMKYQAASAEQCVRPITGVRGLTNRIMVRPVIQSPEVGRQIAAALARQASREAGSIDIAVAGDTVTLRGSVHSMSEHDAIVGAASATNGVARVVDRLHFV